MLQEEMWTLFLVFGKTSSDICSFRVSLCIPCLSMNFLCFFYEMFKVLWVFYEMFKVLNNLVTSQTSLKPTKMWTLTVACMFCCFPLKMAVISCLTHFDVLFVSHCSLSKFKKTRMTDKKHLQNSFLWKPELWLFPKYEYLFVSRLRILRRLFRCFTLNKLFNNTRPSSGL